MCRRRRVPQLTFFLDDRRTELPKFQVLSSVGTHPRGAAGHAGFLDLSTGTGCLECAACAPRACVVSCLRATAPARGPRNRLPTLPISSSYRTTRTGGTFRDVPPVITALYKYRSTELVEHPVQEPLLHA
jgi:hypothetical protein